MKTSFSHLDPTADHHVHSTYSDGEGTLAGNVAAARRLGLSVLGFAEHVRASTDWVPLYSSHVRQLQRTESVRLVCGVEAKILDQRGNLDLPDALPGVERVLAADHQFPGHSEPINPDVVREAVLAGAVRRSSVVEGLVSATEAAMKRRPRLLLAHLFSLLPKVGLGEGDVTEEQIERLAEAAARTGATLEISERWRCPSVRVARVFMDAGVPIVSSTDAHKAEDIGRYDYVAAVFKALRLEAVSAERRVSA